MTLMSRSYLFDGLHFCLLQLNLVVLGMMSQAYHYDNYSPLEVGRVAY